MKTFNKIFSIQTLVIAIIFIVLAITELFIGIIESRGHCLWAALLLLVVALALFQDYLKQKKY